MKTFSAKPETVQRDWFVVDATDKVLGRLASEVASRLRGKHKAEYTPHVDTGDHIVVVNAEKIRVTGNKAEAKRYYRHSGYPGGIKEITLGEHKLNIYSTSTVKINNVKRFFNAVEEVRSEETEIIPGKKIAFVVKPLPERAPNRSEYNTTSIFSRVYSLACHH